MSDFSIQHGELTTDQIADVVERALEHVRESCGERITAASVDLRLWAAAAIINSVFKVSLEKRIRHSLEQKLKILNETDS